jgi:hypothetical protein
LRKETRFNAAERVDAEVVASPDVANIRAVSPDGGRIGGANVARVLALSSRTPATGNLRNYNSPASTEQLTRANCRDVGEREMLEYAAYTFLLLAIIGGLLYVTMSPEVEQPPSPKPDLEP